VNAQPNLRLTVTRAVLWLLVGVASVVAVARYARGLGATTALSDAAPWGLWIGFDVLSGVALAAGGFVLAATVYIFHLDRYHGLVRPAVLTAFLGYVAVALGLMADLGRPWNIWRPILFWQTDSPLFEVAWCVMLYLTVLALEFLPVVLEGLRFNRALQIARRATLPLVIIGIGLSTLHQSSLGTLFLLARDRLHPLWDSPIMPLLFFVSAVGLGMMMVATESCVSSWLFRREGEWPLLAGLTRAASAVLVLYLALRVGDLAWRGQLGHVLEGSWFSLLFVVELLLSVVIPLLLYNLPTTRGSRGALFAASLCGVGGFVLNRADVGGIAQLAISGAGYVPALTELAVSLGLVAAMALIFLFFVERFPVWEEIPGAPGHFMPPLEDRLSHARYGAPWFGRPQLAAAAWVVGAVLGVALLEATTADGSMPLPEPVAAPRSVAAVRLQRFGQWTSRLRFTAEPASDGVLPAGFTTALLIGGHDSGRAVLFDHEGHQRRLGGPASCGRCHHHNLRLDRATSCAACHRDMYRCTDIFSHQDHVTALGGNLACRRCHEHPGAGERRSEAKPCSDCHAAQIHSDVPLGLTPGAAAFPATDLGCTGCHRGRRADGPAEVLAAGRPSGFAPGYRTVMHELCVGCHTTHERETGVTEPSMSRCAACHRGGAVEPPADEPVAGGIRVVAELETR